MKATSISAGSARRTATRDAVVFLHGHQLERNAARAAAAEAAGTFVLVLAVVAVATDSRVPRGIAAVAIGAALAVAIVISGPVSGAGVNRPGRSGR